MIRTPLKRSVVRIKAKRSKARRGPLRSRAYRNWLKDRGCVACDSWFLFREDCRLIDPAHTANNGTGSKGPDNSCAPLCRSHHREYDAGRKAFELKYAIDMKREAAAHWTAWQSAKGNG